MKYLTTKTYRPASLIDDMDRVFNQFFDSSRAQASRSFPVDIVERSEGYHIQADLPGFTAEDVDVRVEDNLLVIEAKVLDNTETETNDADADRWFVKERREADRKRSFVLPDDVDKSAVEAVMKNGVLSIVLKKKPEAKPFTVKVQGK